MIASRKVFYLLAVPKLADEKGQTLVEYALILLLIALVIAVSASGITTTLSALYSQVAAAFAT